jgi:membrane protein involved in colicin uptake
MSRIESRIKELTTRLSQWWSSSTRSAKQQRADRTADLRREATARAQRAASRVQDFRTSERGQRAASKLNDLRASETAKKAEAALNDLRASETAKKAESALADLRHREPVKKAEESARKVLHDLFSGGSGNSTSTEGH